MSTERLRALEKKLTEEASNARDTFKHGGGEYYDGRRDAFNLAASELATLIAELGQAPVALWCLHILGPDDVHASPSKAHAEKAAAWFNERFKGDADLMRAEVAPWPHSPGSHAEDVGRFCEEWLTPTSPAHTSEARERTDDAYLGGRQEVTVYYVAEVLGGDFDNVPISMFGDPAIFSNRESAEKFCDFASMTGRKHEVREIALNAAMRQEAE